MSIVWDLGSQTIINVENRHNYRNIARVINGIMRSGVLLRSRDVDPYLENGRASAFRTC